MQKIQGADGEQADQQGQNAHNRNDDQQYADELSNDHENGPQYLSQGIHQVL